MSRFLPASVSFFTVLGNTGPPPSNILPSSFTFPARSDSLPCSWELIWTSGSNSVRETLKNTCCQYKNTMKIRIYFGEFEGMTFLQNLFRTPKVLYILIVHV